MNSLSNEDKKFLCDLDNEIWRKIKDRIGRTHAFPTRKFKKAENQELLS